MTDPAAPVTITRTRLEGIAEAIWNGTRWHTGEEGDFVEDATEILCAHFGIDSAAPEPPADDLAALIAELDAAHRIASPSRKAWIEAWAKLALDAA